MGNCKENNPIYFSKVVFERSAFTNSPSLSHNETIILNISQKELSIRSYDKIFKFPTTFVYDSLRAPDNIADIILPVPKVKVMNGKDSFKKHLITADYCREEDTSCLSIKLNDNQIKELLPYCNALDFEPYRNKAMKSSDEGCIGYYDGCRLNFYATTNSYIPPIKLPMQYSFDDEHRWPSERLYIFLYKTYFNKNVQ